MPVKLVLDSDRGTGIQSRGITVRIPLDSRLRGSDNYTVFSTKSAHTVISTEYAHTVISTERSEWRNLNRPMVLAHPRSLDSASLRSR